VTSYTDLIIHRYIFRLRRKPKIPTLLKLILDKTTEAKLLMSRKCPWCAEDFKTIRKLQKHLCPNGYIIRKRISNCPFMYMQLLTNIMNTYNKLKYDIEYKGYNTNKQYYVRSLGQYFRTLEEAFEAWWNHSCG